MQRVAILIGFLALTTVAVSGGPTTNAPSVIVAWDQTPQTNVTGYVVYWGAASRNYTNSIAVSGRNNTSCQITNLVRNVRYFFAATCTDGLRESDYSIEANYQTSPIPTPPINLRITTENP